MNNIRNTLKIAVCELECKSFAHEEVNAAVIKLILNNNPKSVNLYCDNSHYEHIRKIYKTRLNKNLVVKHKNIESPLGKKGEFLRYYLLIKNLFNEFQKLNIEKVYFTNTHNNCLLAIYHIAPKYPQIQLSMILHGELEVHFNQYSIFKKFIRYYSWLGRLIKLTSNRIKFYVVSKHIQLEFRKINPEIKLDSLNHPYLWNNQTSNSDKKNKITKFCCIGSMHNDKGKQNLARLINDLTKLPFQFELSVFGRFSKKIKDPRIKIYNRRFSRLEFDSLIPHHDFILLPYKLNAYQLKASGVFFDALNYEVPIITTSNPFTKYFFNLLGEVGFLKNSYESLLNCMIKNIEKPDRLQIVNMKKQIKKSKKLLEESNFII